MMTAALRLLLLGFALVAFGGGGASLAVVRSRRLSDGELDLGMVGVALLLISFGSLCTALGAGWSGVLAFGGAAIGGSYAFMAQHIGLFAVEVGDAPSSLVVTEEPRQPK